MTPMTPKIAPGDDRIEEKDDSTPTCGLRGVDPSAANLFLARSLNSLLLRSSIFGLFDVSRRFKSLVFFVCQFVSKTQKKFTMEGQNCSSCGKNKPLEDFIGAKGRKRGACQECRDKDKRQTQIREAAKEAQAVLEGKKFCKGCKKGHDLDAFRNELGQEFKVCNETRVRRQKNKKARKAKNKALAVKGESKACNSCGDLIALEKFFKEPNIEFDTCDDCRTYDAGKYKRRRQKNPERLRENKRKSKKRVRARSPLRIKREDYREGAKKRGYEFHLTEEQTYELFKSPCFYCNQFNAIGINGIDRVNNSVGYTIENCVGCCSHCNAAKSKYHIHQYVNLCKCVASYQETGSSFWFWLFKGTKGDFITPEDYKKDAIKRGYEFLLTDEEFYTIASGRCYYCGKHNSPTHKNGVDRKNNSIGYTLSNSVPCCGPCNKVKKERNAEEYIAKCKQVAAHWEGRQYRPF